MACAECYSSLSGHELQAELFSEASMEVPAALHNDVLKYDEFLEILNNMQEYKSLTQFALEIGINKNTPSTTWKKKDEVPFLVKEYLKSKFNKVELKEITKFVEVTKQAPSLTTKKQEFVLSDDELSTLELILINSPTEIYGKERADKIKALSKRIENINFFTDCTL
jgi:hypothetical protein